MLSAILPLWHDVECLGAHDLPWSGGLYCFIGIHPPLLAPCCVIPRSCFRAHFLTSSWDPHFSDFGANLAPTCPPTWSQNPPKIAPRALQDPSKIASYLRSLFGWIFHRFLEDFPFQNPPKINQKSIKNSTQQPNNQQGH